MQQPAVNVIYAEQATSSHSAETPSATNIDLDQITDIEINNMDPHDLANLMNIIIARLSQVGYNSEEYHALNKRYNAVAKLHTKLAYPDLYKQAYGEDDAYYANFDDSQEPSSSMIGDAGGSTQE